MIELNLNSRLRIMMIETGGWGGMFHYTCCLANGLVKHNVDVTVVTAAGHETPFDLKFQIAPVIAQKSGYLKNIFSVYKQIKQERPDLIHIQSWFTARRDWIMILALKLMSIPVVVTAHNLLPHDEEEKDALLMSWSYKMIYKTATGLIAHSKENRDRLCSRFSIPVKQIRNIRHGNYGFIYEKHKEMLLQYSCKEIIPGAEEKRLFLMQGTIRHYKGVDIVLKAIPMLEDPARVHLIVAGKPYGRLLEKYREMAEDLDINECVTFIPGYLDEAQIAKLIYCADAVLFPYRDIFQSGALLAALGFGKPVIASSIGSFPETINDKCGWLIKPDSPSELAAAMNMAVRSFDDELDKMGKESFRISLQEHGWDDIAAQTKVFYLTQI